MATLEQLEGKVWRDPAIDSYLIGTCHQLRKKPIEEFTTEDFRIMIGQQIGLRFLLPEAVLVVGRNPLAEGDYYPGDLLTAVVNAEASLHTLSPALVARVVAVAKTAIRRLHRLPDNADLLATLKEFVDKHAA